MFNFKSNIYVVGFSEDEYRIMLESIPDFIEIHNENEFDRKRVENTDYIVLKAAAKEINEVVKEMKEHGKTGQNLVIRTNAQEFEKVDEFVLNLWPEELTKKQLRYYFKGLIDFIKLEKENEDIAEILNTMMNATDDLIWVKDSYGAHKMFNDSFLDALPSASDGHRKTRQECTDRGHLFIWELSEEEYAEGEFVCMESELEVMEKDETLVLDETLLVASGELRNLVTRKAPLHDKEGKIIGTVGFAKDVTQELQYKKMLEKQAFSDHLTDLYNRHYIYEYLEKKKNVPYVLIYVDLDNFKSINDEYGHIDGDNALILTADILREQFKDCIIGRLGGDEFCVVCDEMTGELQILINSMPQKAKEIYSKNPKFRKIGLSIGYAINDVENPDLEKLVSIADGGMYENKKKHGLEQKN